MTFDADGFNQGWSVAPTVVVMNNGPIKGGQPGTFAAIRGTKSVQALYQLHRSYNVPRMDFAH